MAEAPAVGTRRTAALVAGVPVALATVLAATGVGLAVFLADTYGTDMGPSAELITLALLQAANYRMSGWLSARFRTPCGRPTPPSSPPPSSCSSRSGS